MGAIVGFSALALGAFVGAHAHREQTAMALSYASGHAAGVRDGSCAVLRDLEQGASADFKASVDEECRGVPVLPD